MKTYVKLEDGSKLPVIEVIPITHKKKGLIRNVKVCIKGRERIIKKYKYIFRCKKKLALED